MRFCIMKGKQGSSCPGGLEGLGQRKLLAGARTHSSFDRLCRIWSLKAKSHERWDMAIQARDEVSALARSSR